MLYGMYVRGVRTKNSRFRIPHTKTHVSYGGLVVSVKLVKGVTTRRVRMETVDLGVTGPEQYFLKFQTLGR